MIKRILAVAVLALLASTPLQAETADCGFPPTVAPSIPDGTKATREEIVAAAEAVKAFGKAVNAFLDCQEAGKKELFMVLSREQQSRWAEDFNALVDRLTKVEMSLNEQIRIFNDRG
jgi:hypothetical protein